MTPARLHILARDHSPDANGEPAYWCPVCGHAHIVHVSGAYGKAPKWGWNGSMDEPTFTPSVRWYTSRPEHAYLERPGKIGKQRFVDYFAADAARVAAGLGPEWKVKVSPPREVTLCHVHVVKGHIHILNDSLKLGGSVLPLALWVPVRHEFESGHVSWSSKLA